MSDSSRSSRLTRGDRLRGWAIGTALWLVVWIIVRTLRLTVIGAEHIDTARQRAREAGMPISWAFWHGRQAVLLDRHKRDPVVILASLSRDGEIQTALLERFGYRVTRGSSSRGGARGLINMIRGARAGYEPGFAVDGPKGPRHEVKPGVVRLAKKLGTPVMPATAYAEPAWFIGSWDRTMIPRPFGRGVIVYGNPVEVPTDADESVLEAKRVELEGELRRITAVADGYFQAEAASRASSEKAV